jgi:polysaccharide biosynthesis protein PslG
MRTAALFTAAAWVLAACTPPPPAPPRQPEAAVHVFLWGAFDTTDRDLRLAKDGGFTWVKQQYEWRNIEREAKGRFEWNEPDRITKAIKDHGLKVIARVDGYPGWSRAEQVYPDDGPPDRMSDWTDFLTALATRYKGRVDSYEIWNEPNITREWGGKAPDAREYTEMLRASYAAIKRADPQAIVISGAMSPTTENTDRAKPDTIFLRDMYSFGAKGTFDVLGVHAAGFKSAPETDPAVVANDPVLNNGDPSAPDLRRAYTFRRVEDLRQIMVENGDADKKVAILEMGWTSDNRPTSDYRWHAVTEQEKADYMVRAFKYARVNWPWASMMTVIYIPDPRWNPDQEQLYWSITNLDGTARPAYTALKRFNTTGT